MLGSLGASLWKQRPESVDSRASIQAFNVDRECVVSTVFSSQFKGRKIEIKTSCIRWQTENLQTILDPKVDSAVRGERMAQPKLYEADAEVEAGNWHRFSWDQSRIWISTISATWADQSQCDKISLYGELELRNRLFQDNHARDCKEIEELRRIDCEETDRARQASIDELSVHQERNPTTVSQFFDSDSGFTEQGKFFDRCKRISQSWIRHQLWSDPRSRSDLYYSESQNLAALRFWNAAWYTMWYGYYRKRFWTTTCWRRTILYNLQKFKEFGIFLSVIETWYYRNSKEKRWWNEKRTVVSSFTSLRK